MIVWRDKPENLKNTREENEMHSIDEKNDHNKTDLKQFRREMTKTLKQY